MVEAQVWWMRRDTARQLIIWELLASSGERRNISEK